MSKNQKEPVTEASADVIKLTLHEFCARLSKTVKRPELLGAFEHTERVAARLSDTDQAYRARFDAFINKPV